ncbi:hypothetical protein [Ferruginibacter albus]|uniref:hypothetical protein n=1 Tax=Ferruginibacter albus TaxID=2875540 RepID=UPI001CC584BF|nr:hypothetical protein [Ferruginibacter albus]UAY52684.1 hypothetical protein K9M53_03080 [Ferruginibacter albus]
MKKIFFAVLFLSISMISLAQEAKEEGEKVFKKENLFTGGGVNVGISTYSTVLGANPVLGYSVAKWLDAGIAFNFTYSSSRYINSYGELTGDKLRQLLYGPGVFAKIYPIDVIFVQAQFEENFIHQHDVDANGNTYNYPNISVPSLLVGAGYCTDRDNSREPFFYLSILFDVLDRDYSPYTEPTSSGKPAIVPIIRGGVQIPLFQGSRSRYRSSN